MVPKMGKARLLLPAETVTSAVLKMTFLAGTVFINSKMAANMMVSSKMAKSTEKAILSGRMGTNILVSSKPTLWMATENIRLKMAMPMSES